MTETREEVPRTEMAAPENGRVTIPAQVRRAAHIEPGTSLVMYVEDERVVIETREALMQRIKRDFAATDTGTGSAAEELIAQRRAEATREAGE